MTEPCAFPLLVMGATLLILAGIVAGLVAVARRFM